MSSLICFVCTGVLLLLRIDPAPYFRVFEKSPEKKMRVGILFCTASVWILSYFMLGVDASVELLAFSGAALSGIRLFWTWKMWKEQFLDTGLLLMFSTIFFTFFYRIPYFPAIMIFSAVLWNYMVALGLYVRKNEERKDFRVLLHAVSVSALSMCAALIVIAVYMDKDEILLPLVVVGTGFLVISVIVNRF